MLGIQGPQKLRYGISILSVLLALLMGLLLKQLLQLDVSPLLLAAVVFSSCYGGLVPGLVATVLVLLVNDYFFLPPLFTLMLNNGNDVLQLMVLSLVALFINAIAQLNNITARKQQQAVLQESEKRYSILAKVSQVGIFHTDTEGNCLYTNERWCEITGMSPAQALGEGWVNALHPEDRQRIFTEWYTASHNKLPFESEYRFLRPDGSVSWVLGQAAPQLHNNGEVIGYVGTVTEITARKQAEETLAQEQAKRELERQRLRAILDILPVGVIISDAKGQLLEINPETKAIWGEDAPLVDQVSQYRQYKGWWASTGEPVAAEEWTLARTLATGEAFIGEEIDIETFDGQRKTILNYALAIRDETGAVVNAVAVNVDITDRKQAEEALRQKQEWLDLAQAAAKMGSFEWNIQTNVNIWSKELEALYGLEPGEFGGTYEEWARWVAPDDLAKAEADVRASLETGELFTDWRVVWKNGSVHWLHARARVFYDDNGKPLKMVGINVNISDRKQAEAERDRLLQLEQAARAEAEAANRIKDDFLAIVSHELRSPLNPILGWAKLLKTRKLDAAKTNQALEVIERNAKLQARLIEDLLDVSRVLRDKFSLNTCPVDLVTTIESALETVRLVAQAKSIQLQTQFAINVGKVEGDSNRLQQVVWNLLTNAVKFTPQGGCVEISLKKIGGFAQIQISDTGKGISADFLPHVFDRFRQADEATTRKFGGLGLGLAIVRHIVELHNGSVQVASPGEGLGATFTVKLPVMADVAQTSEDYRLPDSSPNLQGLQIVVVDDDIDTLNLLSFILSQYGAEVKAVAEATKAIEAIAQTQPDLLLSDIAMPEMDGYMLIRQLRALEVGSKRKLPAIALTAFAGETNHNKIISAGFQLHLTKPVEPAELATAIVNLTST